MHEPIIDAIARDDFKALLVGTLEEDYHTTFERASVKELYKTIAEIINEQLQKKKWSWNRTRRDIERTQLHRKKIYYISMEFLMGQSLKNNLYNLGETELVASVLAERGLTLEEIFECEPDAGLGNGGLGRLAACYLDGMVSQNFDVTGFSIRYEYGLFKQKIIDGWQVEMPDNWLPGGQVWLTERHDDTYKVNFYGDYVEYWTENGLKFDIKNQQTVEAVPYDMLISGANSQAVGKLRLWRSMNSEGFDMASFNSGDFTKAQQNSNRAELISKVLYPADNIEEGKELRLKQQYFMVSASCQNIIRDHFNRYGTLLNLADKVAIQINDTHPALCIPELMRIFMDEFGYDWDTSWNVIKDTVCYTNHTILAEALEKWNAQLIRMMMPRIFIIIQEIDRRFRLDMEKKFPGDWGKINYMSPIGDNQVRMANLSIIGSRKVNGVSSLHSEILKKDVFHDFYMAYPEKFTNVTNGIAYRRWLCQSNPELSKLISDCIGEGFKKDALELAGFEKFKDDASVQKRLEQIKHDNKVLFSNKVYKETGTLLNPDGIFIVQAKRLHEYKRQLLNVLRIITRYQMIKNDPDVEMRPEVYLFAAKSAPNYYHAKEVIQLIVKLAEEINSDPVVSKKLQVLFLENYSVSMAEHLMPATEISEQISLAGKEASGTGNMKMMINGAITIGTLDGANVEMLEAVGPENIYIFGQKTDEVHFNIKHYDSRAEYERNSILKAAVDALIPGFAGKGFGHIYNYLLRPSYSIADPYMCLADFGDYARVHQELQNAYEDRSKWNSMSIVNIAKANIFSADRSIRDYARDIWDTNPII
ncbi:MAG: glycogen/starch/alpha-glucan phosphorylase [Clostridia bacterium]|nr:glycogen/starch/alpha-glucan phosphorylase [Clostridia bacterium]